MFPLADIDYQIFCLRRCTDDHALIHRYAGTDKQGAAFLCVEQTIGDSFAGFERDQRAGAAAGNLPLIRCVFIEYTAHDALALGVGQEFALVTEQTAGRDQKCQTGTAALWVHILQFRLTGTQLFHDGADTVFRHVNGQFLDGLVTLAVYFVEQNTRCGNAQFIALTTHVFDQNGQVHFASAGNAERISAVGFGDTQRNVTEQFPHQAVTQLAGGDELAFLTGKGAVVDAESHFHSRFADLGERQCFEVVRCTDRISDRDVFDTADPDNVAYGRTLCRHTLQALNLQQGNNLVPAGIFRIVVVAQQYLLSHLNGTSFNSADTDSAHVFIIINGGDQHL